MTAPGTEAEANASSSFSAVQRSFAFYDELRTSPTAFFRPAQDPKESAGRALHVATDPELLGPSKSVTLCHVPIFLRYSMYDEAADVFQDVSWGSYGGTAAALLAIHHFNNGDGSVVEELEGINERCNIRFTTEVVDTQSSPIVAVQNLAEKITSREKNNKEKPRACAVMGAAWYTVSRSMATVTGVYDMLQVSPSSSSMSLDSMSQYPLFSRTHPSDEAKGILAVEYFEKILGIKNFGIFFVNSDQGISLQKTVTDAAAKRNMTARSVAFEEDSSPRSLRNSLLQLKSLGFNYFLGVLFPHSYESVMEVATDVGVAGSGKFWLVTGHLAETFATKNATMRTGSGVAMGSTGLGVLHDDGAPGLPHYDKFLRQWEKLQHNKEALEYINSKQPPAPDGAKSMTFTRTGDYFSKRPSHYSQFSYDAIAGMGIAACRAAKKSELPDNFFTGKEHHKEFINHPFNGATGKVIFANDSFSRDGSSTNYFLSEIHEIDKPAPNISIFSGKTSMYFDTTRHRWERYHGASAFVYSDGTTTPPAELPSFVENKHGVTSPIQAACLALASTAILTSICLSGFVFVKRKNEVITASQPPFLYMLCVGTLVMSSAIIPTAIDDSIADDAGCSIACMSRIWLASIGFTITFSALFSKSLRINTLLSSSRRFRRVSVRVGDVIRPFFALFLSNVLILVLWTSFAPLEWSRKPLRYDQFGRQVESVGGCYNERWLPYGIALFFVNFAALILAIVEAYRARNIATEFSESKYIFGAVMCIFQALFVGVPLFFLSKEWPSSQSFVTSAVIFIICMAVLLLIFVPKILLITAGATSVGTCNRLSTSVNQPHPLGSLSSGGLRLSTTAGDIELQRTRCPTEVLVPGTHTATGTIPDMMGGGLQQHLMQANQRIAVLEMEVAKLKQSKEEGWQDEL